MLLVHWGQERRWKSGHFWKKKKFRDGGVDQTDVDFIIAMWVSPRGLALCGVFCRKIKRKPLRSLGVCTGSELLYIFVI